MGDGRILSAGRDLFSHPTYGNISATLLPRTRLSGAPLHHTASLASCAVASFDGWSTLIRASALRRVGFWDERMYPEHHHDDLALRIRRAASSTAQTQLQHIVLYVPSSVVMYPTQPPIVIERPYDWLFQTAAQRVFTQTHGMTSFRLLFC